MAGGGAILGGLFGLMLGGPIGGIVGAVFGDAISGGEQGIRTGGYESGADGPSVDCPGCGVKILVGGEGRWICPKCRAEFDYDGYNSRISGAGGHSSGFAGDYGEKINNDQAQDIFFLVVFSLLALMAKADGVVSKEEVKLVDDFIKNGLQLSPQKREAAIKIFNAAKDSNYSFDGLASQFYSIFKNERSVLKTMFDILVHLAHSDGTFHPNEERLIKNAKKIFKISDYEYESLKSRYQANGYGASSGGESQSRSGGGGQSGSAGEDIDKYYAELGCKPSDSNEKIKEAYKKMARDYHPDTVIAKGLPQDFVKFATQRFQQIQLAYEKIKTARNF